MSGPLFNSMSMHHNRLIVVAATRKPHDETIQPFPNTRSLGMVCPTAPQNPFVSKNTSTSPIPKVAETIIGIFAIAWGVQILRSGIPAFKHTQNPSTPTPSDVEHIKETTQSHISETIMSSNSLKSTTRGHAVPFIKLLPSIPMKSEAPPSPPEHKQVPFHQEVISYDQEVLKTLQQAVESLQLAVVSLTEAVTSVQKAIKSVHQDSPSVRPVTPTINSSVTVPPEKEGMKMETQVSTTSSSNVVTRAPTECHPVETNQERLPGKSRKGRKKLDKRRNRKNQLQKTDAQDKDQLDDVSTVMTPSVQSSDTLDDNGNDVRAQTPSNEDSVEPEVQRGPRKPRGKGRKKEPRVPRRRREVNTPQDVMGSSGNTCPQKENSSSPAVVSSSNAEASDNASVRSQPVLPKQKNRKFKGKGPRNGRRCDQHNPRAKTQVRERAGVPVLSTPVRQGTSEQGTGTQQGFADMTNQLPATPHGNSRESESNFPSRAASPKARGNIRILHNNSNGMNGNRPPPTVSPPTANGQRRTDTAVSVPTMSATPRATESRTEVRPNAFGGSASASSVGNRVQGASPQFSPQRTQFSASSQDVRNGIELPIRTEKRWKPRHRMNRAG